eukprot:5288983-Ditylum_brightwellii.AAC.1
MSISNSWKHHHQQSIKTALLQHPSGMFRVSRDKIVTKALEGKGVAPALEDYMPNETFKQDMSKSEAWILEH